MKIRTFIVLLLAMMFILPVGVRAEVLAQFPELTKPGYLTVDGDNIYIVNGATVRIYSMKDYKLKGTFGSKGEGPREFAIFGNGVGQILIFPQKDNLHVNSMGKISTWSKDGSFISETKSNPMISMIQPFGKGYAALGAVIDEKSKQFSMATNLYDLKLNKIKELSRLEMMRNQRFKFPFTTPIIFVTGDKLVVPGVKNAFSLYVFDTQGKKTAHITREYKLPDMTEKYKESILEYFRTSPFTKANYDRIKKNISFSDTFPAIRFFQVSDGLVLIRTYKKSGDKDEFFVYNTGGTFVKQGFLKVYSASVLQTNPSVFKNKTYYQLVENEDEEIWELHANKIW